MRPEYLRPKRPMTRSRAVRRTSSRLVASFANSLYCASRARSLWLPWIFEFIPARWCEATLVSIFRGIGVQERCKLVGHGVIGVLILSNIGVSAGSLAVGGRGTGWPRTLSSCLCWRCWHGDKVFADEILLAEGGVYTDDERSWIGDSGGVRRASSSIGWRLSGCLESNFVGEYVLLDRSGASSIDVRDEGRSNSHIWLFGVASFLLLVGVLGGVIGVP